MKPVICITKVVLTEYNRSTKVINLTEIGQELFLFKSSRIMIEDALCKLFSTPQFLCVKAR